jgi:predicted RND superfamily exporter protein
MNRWALWVSKKNTAWSVVVVVAAITVFSLVQLTKIENDDNLLAFLPQDNPEVKSFYEVNERFGSLDLALIGIETDDVFDSDFLDRLRKLTKHLEETRGLNHTLSLANAVDFTPDQQNGGIITSPLVQHLPQDAKDKQALRLRVMSKDHVVGQLISKSGRAVQIYCFLAYGTDPKVMAATIKEEVESVFPDHKKYYGGGPFVSTYIYNSTQKDIRTLTPWAVLAIIIIMTLAFRDFIGVCLVLVSTGIGVLFSIGMMAFFNVPFNIVLGSMPVILFAIGTAYGIHILTRYYSLVQTFGPKRAIVLTMSSVGPTVLAAGLTTAAGLASFVVMDIVPLKTFGFFTALGIVATIFLSLTLIPAIVVIGNLSHRPANSFVVRRWMVKLTVFAQTHRLGVGVALGLISLVAAAWVSRVDTSMDQTTFFAKNSPPDEAQNFLKENFGGSQFVQVHIQGDMNDPLVIREVQKLADHLSILPHVSSVLHLGQAFSLSNAAMVGQYRIPDTPEQVSLLYSFLASDPSIAQLVTPDRKQALIHIKVGSNRSFVLARIIDEIEKIMSAKILKNYVVVDDPKVRSAEQVERKIELAFWRMRSAAKAKGLELTARQLDLVKQHLGSPIPAVKAEVVSRRIEKFLASEECAVDFKTLEDPSWCSQIAGALSGLGPNPNYDAVIAAVARVTKLAGDDILVEDIALSVHFVLVEMWKEQQAAKQAGQLLAELELSQEFDPLATHLQKSWANAFLGLSSPTVMLSAQDNQDYRKLAMTITGLPVMYRGLSSSVTANQIKSLGFALFFVLLIMAIMFRSVLSGLLVSAPTILTLLIIYGGMGLLDVHLDIGTSMLASLILGAGVDYAVHLVAAWRAEDKETMQHAAARAADHTGPAIWTNAIMVSVGFYVLTLGEAKPLQNVGGLTATAMLVAALATFLAIPALARKMSYRKEVAGKEAVGDSEALETILSQITH